MLDAEAVAVVLIDFKLFGGDEILDEELARIGLQVVADRDDIAPVSVQVPDGFLHLVICFAEAYHDARFDKAAPP